MTSKIKELRKLIPVPMTEALHLLKANDGDVEKCVYLFKAKSVRDIQEQTGCDADMAGKYYEDEKYDLNRAVSAVREALYDSNYTPIEGVTEESISTVLQWLRVVESDDFGVSLDFRNLDTALSTMSLIPEMKEVADMVGKAKKAKDEVFEGYVETGSLEEFVRRHKQLDDRDEFQSANNAITLSIIVLKEYVLRHLRNLRTK